MKYTHAMYVPSLLPDFSLEWVPEKMVVLLIEIKKKKEVSFSMFDVSLDQQDTDSYQEVDHSSLKFERRNTKVQMLCPNKKTELL